MAEKDETSWEIASQAVHPLETFNLESLFTLSYYNVFNNHRSIGDRDRAINGGER